MKLLAINTAFQNANICANNGENEHYITIDSNCKHSENLLVNIEKALETVKCKINDVEYISVVSGPGSFTGLRISVATAKALLVTNKNMKAISINSLMLLAFSYFEKNKTDSVCVLLNALSGFYFFAEYSKQLEEISCPQMITKENFDVLVGKKVISNEKLEIIDNEVVEYDAIDLLKLSKIYANNGKTTEEKDLLPLYLRASQAEDNLRKKG